MKRIENCNGLLFARVLWLLDETEDGFTLPGTVTGVMINKEHGAYALDVELDGRGTVDFKDLKNPASVNTFGISIEFLRLID